MPFQAVENDQGALGSIAGLVGGYLAGNPERKAKQAAAQAQAQQQGVENKRADADLALRTRAVTDQEQQQNQDTPHDRFVRGVLQRMTLPVAQGGVGPAPDAKSKPEDITAYIFRVLQYAQKTGVEFKELLDPQTINALSELEVRQSTVPKNNAQTANYRSEADLHQAQAQHVRDYAKDQKIKLDGDLAKIQAQNGGKLQVANIQAAGAYARAQMAQAGANARSAASLQEREAVATEAMQLKAADILAGKQSKSDAQYYENARAQYTQEMQNWRNENTVTKGAGPDGGNGMTAQPDLAAIIAAMRPQQQPSAPNVSVSVPGQPDNSAALLGVLSAIMAGQRPGQGGGAQAAIDHKLNPKGGNNRAQPAKKVGHNAARPSAADEVKAARAAGVTDANTIRQTLKQYGYSDAEINAALPPAPPAPNPFARFFPGWTH